MVGKYIQYVIWEYDAGSNDEIYRSGRIKLSSDLVDTPAITITQTMFKKGIDLWGDPDKNFQNYFIEVLPLDVSAYSKKFGVDSDGLMEVEKVTSAAIVKEKKQESGKKGECFCNKDFEEKDVRKLVKLLKGSETIWEGQALKGGKRAVCNISDKSFSTLTTALNNSFKKYKINTCAQKMHFLAQVCEELELLLYQKKLKANILLVKVFIKEEEFYN